MIRKTILFCLLILGSYITALAQSSFSWPEVTYDNKPWTRWWWFGNAVDTPGIKYNLRQFQKAGIGGVEITPIYGVRGFENKFIDFLSPQWMKMLAFTIEEAHNLGMRVDMTTGSGWPFGGPQITIPYAASKAIFQIYSLKEGEKLLQPVVVKNARQKGKGSLQILMAYSGKGKIANLTDQIDKNNQLKWVAPAGDWKLIAVFDGKTLQKVKRAAPGGKGLVMNPFSEKALQEYLQPFSQAFEESNGLIPHAFFDDSYEVTKANWSNDFLNVFYRKRGYYLQHYLPELLGHGNKDTVARVIADYRQTLAEMLLNNFTKPWIHWTHKMGSLARYQAHGSPGNLLDLYGAADIPEMESFGSYHFNIPGLREDSLYPRQPKGTLDPLLLKFASSAAHVMGKNLVSSETFTWLGEHFRVSLAQCKPVLDQLFLSGINHVYFQGSPYSPKDAPWPGWQFYASMNVTPYNTFWYDIFAFNRYITRVQSFLQKGRPDNDVLLYWPVQDLWARNTGDILLRFTVHNASEWLDSTPFYRVGAELMKEGYSVDYISDKQLEKISFINGSIKTPGAAYHAIVIPPVKYMPVTTLKKIVSLIKAGATIIFAGGLPLDVPGLDRLSQRRKLFNQLKNIITRRQSYDNHKRKGKGNETVFIGNNLRELMYLANLKPSGFPDAGLQFIRRKEAGRYIYFVSNLHDRKVNQWIPLAKNISSAVFYNPYNGHTGKAAIKTIEQKDNNRITAVYLQLKPGQSMIINAFTNKIASGDSWHYTEIVGEPIMIDGSWEVSFEKGMPNIDKNYTMNRLKSWTTLSDSAKVFAGTAKYTLIFYLPQKKAGDWLLSLGKVNFSADVKINGQSVGCLWTEPFEIRIGKYLKPGRNTLEIEVTNIGANRIADYDRKGIEWKKFYNINMVNMDYKPFDASFWKPVSSGLLGPVTLIPLKEVNF